jgi:hypothetical protein
MKKTNCSDKKSRMVSLYVSSKARDFGRCSIIQCHYPHKLQFVNPQSRSAFGVAKRVTRKVLGYSLCICSRSKQVTNFSFHGEKLNTRHDRDSAWFPLIPLSSSQIDSNFLDGIVGLQDEDVLLLS